MKRNFKQRWSTIPPIPTKRTITSHLQITEHKIDNSMLRWKSKSWLGTVWRD